MSRGVTHILRFDILLQQLNKKRGFNLDFKAIGARIKSARTQAGLTQAELADNLGGMTQPAIHRMETGASALTLANLVKLQDILGHPVSYFLGLDTDLTEDEQMILAIYRRLPTTGPARRFAYHSLASLLIALTEAPNELEGHPPE